MELKDFKVICGWDAVKAAALATVHKRTFGTMPDRTWKKNMLLAEHSPIRMLQFSWRWEDMKHWVTVHFVRHHEGVEKFVSTQRSDRTGIDRSTLSQDAEQDLMMCCNAQAMINISRKRLCQKASPETRAAWQMVKDRVAMDEPELASVMVPECVYRGFCPEPRSCGYWRTGDYKVTLRNYHVVD